MIFCDIVLASTMIFDFIYKDAAFLLEIAQSAPFNQLHKVIY